MQNTLRYFLYQIRLNKKNGASYSQLKHFFKWKRSLKPDASSVKDEQPWITFDAIDFLKANVNSSSKVFEYGGGGSTLFFVKRAGEVHTVEHDKKWFGVLSKIVADKKYSNWKGSFVLPEKKNIVEQPDIANPEHYAADDENSRGYNYKEYVSVIDKFSDNYFDFVLVDGRSRPACMTHSIPKIKKGGYLILDNSERPYYLEKLKTQIENDFEVVIDKIGACPYSKTLPKTSVWRKK